MTTDLILGTAGHIDHGKTSLIRALTGVDCDRLPEEKKRGITIDIGFAELTVGDYRLGIVDVPGHERFVRNMLAGATGMDVAMLIIAADESIRQQTREHLEILRMLSLEAGVVALTKCDLVDNDWMELVEGEIREFVAGSFLDGAPIVRVSAHTGQGLDELKAALVAAAEKASGGERARRGVGPFRMAIDRTFTIAGHGTVVTGSVSSGACRIGDELVIEPGGVAVRVRGLQNHDRTVEIVHRGQRAAINLAGVHHNEIQRGRELASAGHLKSSRLLTVELKLLPAAPHPLKSRNRIRIHVGTAELLASVLLLDCERLEPGQSGLVQLFLSEPAVTTWNQPFVARSESPVVTIGGGRVLDPAAEKLRHPNDADLALLRQLKADDPVERASAAMYFFGLRDWRPADLGRTAGIAAFDDVYRELVARGDVREIPLSPTRRLRVHARLIERLCERIEAALHKMHEQNPLKLTIDRQRLVAGFDYLGDAALLDAVLETMRAAGRIRVTDRGVALVGHGPKLSQNEQKLLVQLVELYRQAGVSPPTVKEMQQQATKNQSSVPQLIALAAADGQLVEVSSDLYLHADVARGIRESLAGPLATGGLTVSQIREILNTSRKFAVPICEYLDRVGFTERQGDVRVLAKRSQV